MPTFAYQISQEQFTPRQLLDLAKRAERAGFDELASSDHLFPWSNAQGHSGFTWSWLGAALEATSIPIGVVNCPYERYHPVIIAQACATLWQMYPGRFWPTFGTGEFLNEHITGKHWPEKAARNRKLAEAIDVMSRLWRGEHFTHRGEFITAEDVRLFTLPENEDDIPPLVGCAITARTAADISAWADGLYTVYKPHAHLDDTVDSFLGGEEVHTDDERREHPHQPDKSLILKVDMACGKTREEAIAEAYPQWRTNVGASAVHGELRSPEQFEEASQFTTEEDVASILRISQDPEEHAELIRKDLSLGFDKIVFHSVGLNQDYFIDWFGKEVLPRVR